MHALYRLIPAACAILLFAGCVVTKVTRSVLEPPIASYQQNDNTVPMRRVAVLPIYVDDNQQPIPPAELDLVFHAELTKTSKFEVVPISRAELKADFGFSQISSTQIIPGDVLTRLANEYAADGILFTDLTHYSPYRPVAIGVRCKLVDSRSGVQRWVFDHLFDTASPDIALDAKRYCMEEEDEQLPIPTDGESILQSPTQFGKYVAYETYRSLPPIQISQSEDSMQK